MSTTIDRTKSIGASEIAAILGMDPNTSPYEVWARKRGEMPEREASPFMTRGLKLEPIIRQELADELGITLAEVEVQIPLRHPTHEFLTATLDAMVKTHSLIEEWKTAGHFAAKEWGKPGTNEVPPKHALQNSFQTVIARAVLGLEFSMRLRLVPTETLEGIVYPLQYDPDLGEMLVEAGVRFWKDHVETGVPPALSGTSAEAELFKKRYKAATPGKVIEASEKQIELVKHVREVRKRLKTVENYDRLVTLELMESMGDAETLIMPARVKDVTWKNDANGKPSWKSIAEELGADPATIKKHTPEIGTRVLRVAAGDEEDSTDE